MSYDEARGEYSILRHCAESSSHILVGAALLSGNRLLSDDDSEDNERKMLIKCKIGPGKLLIRNKCRIIGYIREQISLPNRLSSMEVNNI